MTSADLNIHLSEKLPKWLRTGSLRAVDRRIARPSSFTSFWVRGGSFCPPPWRRWLRPPPGRGLTRHRLGRGGRIRPPPPLGFSLTFALLGGGCLNTPPCGFSRIARKRRRAAPPGFYLPYPPSFCQLLWKFRSWVMQGQVTRSGQVTIPYKNFTIAPQLQCLRESYETFGIW